MDISKIHKAIRDVIVEQGVHKVHLGVVAMRLGVSRMAVIRRGWGGSRKSADDHCWQRMCAEAVAEAEAAGDTDLTAALAFPRRIYHALGGAELTFGLRSYARFTPIYEAARDLSRERGSAELVTATDIAERVKCSRAQVSQAFGILSRLPDVLHALYPNTP